MANRNLVIVAFLIVVGELLLITFIVDAVKIKLTEGVITQDIQRQRIIASQVANTLKEDHKSMHDQISLIVQRPEILSGSANDCNLELEKISRFTANRVDNLIRVDQKGNIYCAQNKEATGINVLTDENFKALFANPGSREQHAHIMHRVTFSPVSKQLVVGMHMAVFSDKGEFLGTFGGAIYISNIKERFFKDITSPDKNNISLVDDNGDLLYHPKPEMQAFVGKNLLSEEVFQVMPDETAKEKYVKIVKDLLNDVSQGRTGISHYNNPPQPETITVYYPVEILPDRHWAVAVSIPVDEIVNQLDESSLVSGLKSFSVLLVAMLTIVLITQISMFFYLSSHLGKHGEDKI